MKAGLKFMVDTNVGKLARWLRMMGYDAAFFTDGDDAEMIATALKEDRVIITRDSHIMKRGVVTGGRLRAILVRSDEPERQIREVVAVMGLAGHFKPFTLCLECNQPLKTRQKDEVKGRVPPYVFGTQHQFVECPSCRRIYWRGTHWAAMNKKLEGLFRA